MSATLIEVVFILLLIGANGVFAMSELAVVSARKARLRQRAEEGDREAGRALQLADDPNRFLSTVQVGITLVGTCAGAFGGLTIAESIADALRGTPFLAPYSKTIGLAVVVLSISYFSLVLGELVPKRLAMSNPERIAAAVARPLWVLSAVGVPIVWFLSQSTEVVLRLLGVGPSPAASVTEEEVRFLLKEGTEAGVFERAEQEMVKRVLRLGDQRAGNLMTPRTDVVWIDAADSPEEVRRVVSEFPHSQYPVCEQTLDNVLGVAHVKDLLADRAARQPFDLRGVLRIPPFLYEGARGLKVLETFKKTGTRVSIVLDEYGSVRGILTPSDILVAIVGDLPTEDEVGDRPIVQRPDGSWLLDGMLDFSEFRDLFEARRPPAGEYRTIAGLVLEQLGRIPSSGDAFEWEGLRFEVVDMDDKRVDKVLVTPPTDQADSGSADS